MSQLKNIKLNTPTYREIVPSSGKEVKIKPFKVGDEKTLLIASESKDTNQMVDSLKRVITSCVIGEEVENLTSYDIEYLFIKIRSKSVGEVTRVGLKCEGCETQNEIAIDLDKIKVINLENRSNKVKVTDDLYLEMKDPSIDIVSNLENSTDGILNFICSMVKIVYYGEEVIEIGPNEVNDVKDIIEQLTANQFVNLQNWITNMPKLHETIEYTCSHCSAENKIELEGLADFF